MVLYIAARFFQCMMVIMYGYGVAGVWCDDVWMNSTLSASFSIRCTMHRCSYKPSGMLNKVT